MTTQRRIQRGRATFKVFATDLLVEAEDGEDYAPRAEEWIKLQKRFPMKLFRVAARLSRLSEVGDLDEAEEAMDRLVGLLAPIIADWNWTDQDAPPGKNGKQPPLPKPREDSEALWALDIDEVMWITSQLMERTESPNPPGSPSSEQPTTETT